MLLPSCQPGSEAIDASSTTSPVDTTLQNVIRGIPQVTSNYHHQVMTLGSFHFDRSGDGSDVVASNSIDITSTESQAQIEALVDEIVADFHPTIIAVEWMPRLQATFDSLYREYRAGNWELVKNEAFQIGFRVAAALDLPTIYCVDNRPPQPESLNEIDDWEAYADSLGHTAVMTEYDADNQAFNEYMDQMLTQLDLLQYLKLVNSPEHVRRYKQLSLTGLVHLGHGDLYPGADLTGNWYRRNTRIFSNVRNLCQSKEERVLIIYGAGHKWVLDELFDGSPEFEVVQPFR